VTKLSSAKQFYEDLKNAVIGGSPVLAVETWEEDLATEAIIAFAKTAFKGKATLATWDCRKGLVYETGGNSRPTPLVEALDEMCSGDEPAFFIIKDSSKYFIDVPFQRRIKDFSMFFRGKNRFLVLLGAIFRVPAEIQKEVYLLSYKLPDDEKILSMFQAYSQILEKRQVKINLETSDIEAIVTGLRGFTTAEITRVFNKVFYGLDEINPSIISQFYNEKEQLAKKTGILEYVRSDETIENVGGLDNLKEWLIKRKELFSKEAQAANIKPPGGLLMMGISGCGKSLSVKTISRLWKLPLFRMDMNRIYSGIYGTPEGAFAQTIDTIEAMAPAILWIDEIEGGISSSSAKDGGTGSHIFSSFLTWMQEKSSDVFVAATANRIDLLPAEIIRKGRFDEIFFLDLPNDHEREEIFRIHIKKTGTPPEDFDLTLLGVATEFWNGAEIEHAVTSAKIESFYMNQPLTQDHLYNIIRNTVPLSRTMSEQIKFIKNWASERALPASRAD